MVNTPTLNKHTVTLEGKNPSPVQTHTYQSWEARSIKGPDRTVQSSITKRLFFVMISGLHLNLIGTPGLIHSGCWLALILLGKEGFEL